MMSTQDLLREEISPLSRKHISDIATDLIIDGQDYWPVRSYQRVNIGSCGMPCRSRGGYLGGNQN